MYQSYIFLALVNWLIWLEHHHIHQKVDVSIPGLGAYGRQPISVYLTLMFLSLSPYLSQIS